MSSPPSIDDIDAMAAVYPHDPKHFHVVRGQIEQRAQLVGIWGIKAGEKILEIGCGQGDCTVVLATAVGDEGSVTAVDPASLDYGSPFTLGQAQAHLRASPVGRRIAFVQSDPIAFVQNSTERYTTAVLAQCIWYFSSPEVLTEILAALLTRVDRVCISEYSLTASDYRASPHVLAVFTEAALECRKKTSTSNVRTVLSPERLRAAAVGTGFVVAKEVLVQPPEGMLDGIWEVKWVLSEGFGEEIEKYVEDGREKAVVIAGRDSVRAAAELVKSRGDTVRTMDIWVATLTKREGLPA